MSATSEAVFGIVKLKHIQFSGDKWEERENTAPQTMLALPTQHASKIFHLQDVPERYSCTR